MQPCFFSMNDFMRDRISAPAFRWGLLIWLSFCGLNANAAGVVHEVGKIRALHVVAKNVEPTDMKRIIDQAHANRFNVLVLGLYNAVRFKSMPIEKEQVPTWSVDEFIEVVAYARAKGLEVVPELALLSHQEFLLAKYKPHLLFNATTYDPRKQEVYDIVIGLLSEIIELVHPHAIHIGHDEVSGFNPYTSRARLGRGKKMLPADLFLEDVKQIHSFLESKKVETWMWGDMLVSPEEFPDLLPQSLHGTKLGYGPELRKKLPKNIVICDWRYKDQMTTFPTMHAFKSDGFRVIGATFERSETTRNFSRYAASVGADGMIATTWFHVQKKEWDEVGRIIRESGESFNKDFPDEK